jgi:hypothetical protein
MAEGNDGATYANGDDTLNVAELSTVQAAAMVLTEMANVGNRRMVGEGRMVNMSTSGDNNWRGVI